MKIAGRAALQGPIGARQVSTALLDRPDKAPFAAGGMPISWARAWFSGAETGPSGQRCRLFRCVVAALGGWISPATFQAILHAKARSAVRMPRTTQAAGVNAPRFHAMANRLPAEERKGPCAAIRAESARLTSAGAERTARDRGARDCTRTGIQGSVVRINFSSCRINGYGSCCSPSARGGQNSQAHSAPWRRR